MRPVLALVLPALVAAAQEAPTLAWVAEVLGAGSEASTEARLRAIAACEDLHGGTEGGLVTTLLFRTATPTFEGDPRLRAAAARMLGVVLDGSSNLAYARRLARLADPREEASPAVRIEALRALARLQNPAAHGRIHEALRPSFEPDASVRATAQEILAANPALAAGY